MTSPVHAKVAANNLVLLQQPSLLPVKKIMVAAMLPFKTLGNFFGPSPSVLSHQGVSGVVTTQAEPKGNLTIKISKEKESSIALTLEGARDKRPHMIAFESFMTRVSAWESAVENALDESKPPERNGDGQAHLVAMHQGLVQAMDDSRQLSKVYGDDFFLWQHRKIRNKVRKLEILQKSLQAKLITN